MEQIRQSTFWRRALPLALLAAASLLAFRLMAAPQAQPEARGPEPLLVAQPPAASTATPAAPAITATTALILVYVSGAVAQPGVYALRPDARLVDALRAAGGPLAEADLIVVNLAARLADEQQIYIPRLGEEPRIVGPTAKPAAAPAAEAHLKINTATAQELEALPRIGPAVAQRIVEHRDENGPFLSPEDLLEVPGIGPSIVEAIAGQIDFGP